MKGVLTGHCPIGTMAARLGISAPDYCRSCHDTEETETIKRLLCDCPNLKIRPFRCMGNRLFEELEDVKSAGWFD